MLLGFKVFCFSVRTVYFWFALKPEAFFANLFERMSRLNMVLVKLLQCSANNPVLWSKSNRALLKLYTDAMPYADTDINRDEMRTLQSRGVHFLKTAPIHSGLVAVVYRGTYRGHHVVIKMKKVNLDKRLQQDVAEVQHIIRIASWVPYIRSFGLEATYDIYRPLIQEQCDFSRELQNQNRYRHNFSKDDTIVVPELYPEICTSETLVMDYIHGVRVEELTLDQRKHFVETAGNIMILSLLIHGFIHCDCHMGNALFIVDENAYKIGLIDFGMCCSMSVNEIDNFYDLFSSIAKKNYDAAGKYFLGYFTDYLECDEIEPKLRRELMALFEKIFYVNRCFSLMEISELYAILSKRNVRTSETWKKLELALTAIDGGFRELQCGGIGLTDMLMRKMNEMEHSQLI